MAGPEKSRPDPGPLGPMTTPKAPTYYGRNRRMLSWSFPTEKTRAWTGGKTTAAAVGVLPEGVDEAAERVLVAAATVGVGAPTIFVDEEAKPEAAVTRQGLGQVVDHPDAVRGVVSGDPIGESVAVVRRAVTVDAGMAGEAVPKTVHQAPPVRLRISSTDQCDVKVLAKGM